MSIILLEDKLKTKEEYTKAYWKEDCKSVRKIVGELINVVFCGSDYDENSFWNQCYPESEFVVFERNKYNSISIRSDVYRYWEWMPKIVRSHFVKKVLLIGGESSGKSTLTINLANYFNTNYLEEVGRDLSEISGTDEMMLSEDYLRILLEHKNREIIAAKESNKVLFEDTDCLITKFFMGFLEGDIESKNVVLADAIAAINNYDLILFLEPDVKWVQDGGRSSIIEADRENYSNKIKKIYEKAGFKFECISGTYLERFKKCINLVEKMLERTKKY